MGGGGKYASPLTSVPPQFAPNCIFVHIGELDVGWRRSVLLAGGRVDEDYCVSRVLLFYVEGKLSRRCFNVITPFLRW